MKITQEQAKSFRENTDVFVIQVTTGMINYADNPITNIEYEVTIYDYDMPKVNKMSKELLTDVFNANKNNDNKVAILTYDNNEYGKYIYLTLEDFLNFPKESFENCIKSQNNLIEKYNKQIEDVKIKFSKQTRKMTKSIKDIQTKMIRSHSIISNYKIALGV